MNAARPLAVVTNDDGIFAPGVLALAQALREDDFPVLLIAPIGERSGSAASMAAPGDVISYERVLVPGWSGDAISVDGTPALCVIAAALGAFGDTPALVASGVNPGYNTGRSTLHSGTIGAALTAAAWGMSGVAVSIDSATDQKWATATALAVQTMRWLAHEPPGTSVNLNVPNVDPDDLAGIRYGSVAAMGAVRTTIDTHSPGRIGLRLRRNPAPAPAGTDTALVRAGFVSVSVLSTPAARADSSVLAAFDQELVVQQ